MASAATALPAVGCRMVSFSVRILNLMLASSAECPACLKRTNKVPLQLRPVHCGYPVLPKCTLGVLLHPPAVWSIRLLHRLRTSKSLFGGIFIFSCSEQRTVGMRGKKNLLRPFAPLFKHPSSLSCLTFSSLCCGERERVHPQGLAPFLSVLRPCLSSDACSQHTVALARSRCDSPEFG